jgi:hypothetical protein
MNEIITVSIGIIRREEGRGREEEKRETSHKNLDFSSLNERERPFYFFSSILQVLT